jgi:hypothetical protein
MSTVDIRSVEGLVAGMAAGHWALVAALEAAWDRWDDPILPAEVPERTFPDTFREDWWAGHGDELQELRVSLSDSTHTRPIVTERCDAAVRSLRQLADSDLEAPWPVGEFNGAYLRSLGIPEPPPTVRGLLLMAALHLDDHATQIRRATAGS